MGRKQKQTLLDDTLEADDELLTINSDYASRLDARTSMLYSIPKPVVIPLHVYLPGINLLN